MDTKDNQESDQDQYVAVYFAFPLSPKVSIYIYLFF